MTDVDDANLACKPAGAIYNVQLSTFVQEEKECLGLMNM